MSYILPISVLILQGNIILATWMAHHLGDDGILTFSLIPRGIKTGLQRYAPSFFQWLGKLLLYPTPIGAITELYAGTSQKSPRPTMASISFLGEGKRYQKQACKTLRLPISSGITSRRILLENIKPYYSGVRIAFDGIVLVCYSRMIEQ